MAILDDGAAVVWPRPLKLNVTTSALSSARFLNVATPPLTAIVVVPRSGPEPLASEAVIVE